MPEKPWPVWTVTLMTACVAIFQFPFYHIPWVYSPLYFAACGLLVYGFFSGARWAFVINVATVWIFPLETWLGIKPPLRGTVLSVLHIIALGLLIWSWRYYWQPRASK